MLIREMVIDDLDKVLSIENNIFTSPYSINDFLYELNENPFAYLYVLEDDDIIGYIDLWICYEKATLANIGINKQYQNKGYGSKLMQFMLDKASKCENISLEVNVFNESAIRLYKKYGFEIKAIRKNYYEGNQDAYLMVLEMEE